MYVYEQYEKFFDLFEGDPAGWVYKPRTFASTRLMRLFTIFSDNFKPENKIVDEDKIKENVSSDPKLGKAIVDCIYGDFYKLEVMVNSIQKILNTESNQYVPDLIDAIYRWRKSLNIYKENS